MSVLTRIKNNQITDSTIWANAKIIPGSIVGSLFSSNITVTSDFTITGNLTVQGAATYLTVASTNTYVNDPLIVLNNAFSGSNSYDLGFIFNRGSDPNKAFYWDESSDEFRLITTTETGTTYGSIAAETNYENLRLGNIYLNNYTSTRALFVGASGLVTTDAEYTYDSTNDTLTIGKFLIVGNSAVTIRTTGTNQDLTLAPSGSGVVDFNGTNATNLADPLSSSDAVTLSYLNTQLSSAVTNIQLDDTDITITDTGSDSGLITANIDTLRALTITGNNLGFFGDTASTSKLYIDKTNSNVAITSTLFVTGVATLNSRAIVSSTVPASSYTTGAVTVQGGVGIGGNLYAGAGIQNTVIGNVTAADGSFTTLTATSVNSSGNILGTAATFNSSQINGNESVTGYLNVTGNILGSAGTLTTLDLNSGTNSTDATGTTGALQVAGGGSIAKDLWIGGNLYVSNIYGITVEQISVSDPLLYLTAANTYPYNYDIGFFSHYIGGPANIEVHTGVVRDASDGYWKLFSNVDPSPTTTFTFNGSEDYDGLKAGNLILTGTGTAISAAGFINTTGNISGAAVNASALNVTGNVLGQAGTFNALTVNGNESVTGYLNVTGNVMASAITGASLNTTGNVSAATVIAGQFNTTGNLSASQVSTATLNATGFINTAGNVSASQLIAETLSTRAGYGNIHLNQYASIFAEGNNGQNQSLFQGTTTGLSDGVGIWAFTGGTSTLYSSREISFLTGATMRAQDTPTGGVRNVSINSGGHLFANVTTDTSSLTTGAIVAAGGVAVGKTLWVGEGARINSTRAAEAFQVYGATGNDGLIYTNTAKNAIVFSSTGNVTVQDGVIAKFDSAGAILLPVGSNAQRPGAAGNVDVAGMLRFNNTSNGLEYFDGADWTVAGSEFTVIATNSFSGNGNQYTYTLSAASTTAGTLVMINGVVQIPTTAYSVTGTSLTFTEAPATGDTIDARTLITTATVSAISSGNGFNNFDVATTPYANVTAGTSAATVRISVDGADGSFNLVNGTKTAYNQTVINAPGTNLAQLDSFATSKYATAKYIIQIKDGANIESAEVLLAQDTANVNVTTYAVIAPAGALGTFSANIVSGDIKLWYTPTLSTNANIKVKTDYIV